MVSADLVCVAVSMMKTRMILVMVLVLVAQTRVARVAGQGCSQQLGNLNSCAPFVVPGSNNPSSDCCAALQTVDHDCLCNTLRITAQLPALCQLPPLTCPQ